MSQIGKEIRLGRMFREDDKTLIVPMESLEAWGGRDIGDWAKVARGVIKGGADVIMTVFGIAKQYYKELVGKDVSLVITIDLNALEYVEKAAKMGADGIKSAYFGPIENFPRIEVAKLAGECEKNGMPFLFEVVPLSKPLTPENPQPTLLLDTHTIRRSVRMAVSAGADFVKTSYTGTPETFREVVEDCPAPVVVLGGPKIPNKETLERIKGAMDGGASGGAFGRNITMHENPEAITRAIVKIIHENAGVEEALKELE